MDLGREAAPESGLPGGRRPHAGEGWASQEEGAESHTLPALPWALPPTEPPHSAWGLQSYPSLGTSDLCHPSSWLGVRGSDPPARHVPPAQNLRRRPGAQTRLLVGTARECTPRCWVLAMLELSRDFFKFFFPIPSSLCLKAACCFIPELGLPNLKMTRTWRLKFKRCPGCFPSHGSSAQMEPDVKP